MIRRRSASGARLALGLLAWAALAPALPAQGGGASHVLLVTALSGEPRFSIRFHAEAASIYDAAKTRWGVADSSLIYLAEDPGQDPARIRGRATRDGVAAALGALARRSAAGDVVLVVLIGHGSGEGPESRLNLPGPDASAADFATWLHLLDGRLVVFVNAASASGDFRPVLSAPGRIIITATRSAMERNETTFAEQFSKGLTSEAGDADKDGRITVMEAFTYARLAVARYYEAKSQLATEHAQLSGDTTVARAIAFGTAPAPTDPRIAVLFAERRALENQVDQLRRRKTTMDSTAYERELERLLLEIATRTAAIRAVEGRKP
jgi:hypothetical protein